VNAPFLIALGNRFRRDDAVGPLVLERFAEYPQTQCHGDPLGLMAALEGRSRVLLVDAVTGPHPGRIHRWTWENAPPPLEGCRLSTHGGIDLFSIFQLLEERGTLPPSLQILALEGSDFGWGEQLSEPVRRALPDFIDGVKEALDS
jgi:hydrogenase maturation protease